MAKVATSVLIMSSISFIWNAIAIGLLLKCNRMVYQIRVIAINLSLADLMTALHFLYDALITKYELVAKHQWCIIRCHIDVTLCMTSISFITLFAFDGFLCLKFAMKYYTLVTKRRVILVCLATWIISFAVTAMSHLHGFQRTFACICFDNRGHPIISMIYRNTCFLTIIVIYAYIFWHVRQQNRQLAVLGNQQGINTRSAVKIGAVVGIIFIMYFPKHIFILFSALRGSLIYDNLTLFTPCVYIEKLNILVNPLVYVLRFRECRMHAMRAFCWYNDSVMKKAQLINFELSGTCIQTTKKPVKDIDTKEQSNTIISK